MIKSFEEDSFYVSTGSGEKWSDYEGPFKDIKDAIELLGELCDEWSSPEILNSSLVVYFKEEKLDLVKDDSDRVINGQSIVWGNAIMFDGKLIRENHGVT